MKAMGRDPPDRTTNACVEQQNQLQYLNIVNISWLWLTLTQRQKLAKNFVVKIVVLL